ncbi:MAG: phosphomevalonate kinase, partial [Mycobacteriaceae bacterium]|nr:phosphomevalonate kinase [Mycobacteriaceae bacterium]
GLSVRPLPEPSGLVLRVGWTGTPASTPSMIAALDSRGDASFISGSAQCVQRLIAAAEADDGAAVQSEIRCARELLIALDHSVGGGIMTPRLRALCEAGEAVGAAAKPSGAGGGDCGIALLPRVRPAADAELTGRWIRAGIQPLDLHTSQYFQNDP